MSDLEKMAKVGYEKMFEEKWDELNKNSIERELWLGIAKAMVLSFNFPHDFVKLHKDIFMGVIK